MKFALALSLILATAAGAQANPILDFLRSNALFSSGQPTQESYRLRVTSGSTKKNGSIDAAIAAAVAHDGGWAAPGLSVQGKGYTSSQTEGGSGHFGSIGAARAAGKL